MKRLLLIAILALSTPCLQAAVVVFEKPLGNGQSAVLQGETNALQETRQSACRYTLLIHSSQDQSERAVWLRDLPLCGTNISKIPGFYFLDLTPTTNGWFLCYKVWDKDFVERIDAAGQTSEAPQELNWDLYSSGLVVTKAQFSETNDVPLLRVRFKNYKTQTWTHQGSAWIRAPQYDVTIPLWARPFTPSPKTPGDRESFPAQDYPQAAWGKPAGGFQLGLRMEKNIFHAGERVHGIVHTRNASDHQLAFDTTTVASKEGPVDFVIIDAQSKPVPCTTDNLAAYIPPQAKPLPSGTQHVQTFSLERQYDLRPGTYSIVAVRRLAIEGGKSLVIDSGKTSFQVSSP